MRRFNGEEGRTGFGVKKYLKEFTFFPSDVVIALMHEMSILLRIRGVSSC